MSETKLRCPYSIEGVCSPARAPIELKGGKYRCEQGPCLAIDEANRRKEIDESLAELNRTLKSVISDGSVRTRIF